MLCPRCGQEKEPDTNSPHICVDCAKADRDRTNRLRVYHGDWITAAKEAGLDPWLQQPGETQWEYSVWVAYRDAYPGKKPSYEDAAQQLNTTRNAVYKIAQRWSFQARLQLWMAECDRITMTQRRSEILNMNKEHVDMAARLRHKLSVAIDAVVPEALKPSELATLMKVSTDLERKARLDEISVDEEQREALHGPENAAIKKDTTKGSDLSEVVKILMDSGALGSITQIGVRETTTTTRETIMRDDAGNASSMIEEEGD